MPTRILRDWTDSLRFDGLTADAERLFIRLIMKADDFGRYHAEPRLIRAHCFPLTDTLRANDLIRWLDELSTRQLILRYEASGRSVLAIVDFGQRLRTMKAKFPPPDGQAATFVPTNDGGSPSNVRDMRADVSNPPPDRIGGESESDNDLDNDSDFDKKAECAGAHGVDKPRPATVDDAGWIAELQAMECYKPLSVTSELGKATAWAKTNHRQCTRRFFLNWLNRALESGRTIAAQPTRRENIKVPIIEAQ